MSMISPTGSSPTSPSGTSGMAGGLTQNDFLSLMVAQLQNQDPLNPVSSDQFLTEMAAFTEVVDLQSVVAATEAAQSVALIGKTVTAQTSSGAVTGTVSAVDLSSGQPVLTVGSAQVPLASVTSVS